MRQTEQWILFDTACKCLTAASINQTSLYDSLCNLDICLQKYRIEIHNDTIKHDSKLKNINDENNEDDERNLRRVVSYLLQLELVRTGSKLSELQKTIQHKIDECFDLCGLRNSFLVALEMIHSASSKRSETEAKLNWNVCILSSAHVIRRLLLIQCKNGNDLDTLQGKRFQSFLREFFQHEDTNAKIPSYSKVQMQVTHFINSVIVLLPTQIANAFHSSKLKLPYWAVRSNFVQQIIQTSAFAALFATKDSQSCNDKKEDDKMDIETTYFSSLMEVLLRNGSSDDVCSGIYICWKSLMKKEMPDIMDRKLMVEVIKRGMNNLSSRSCSNLIRSSIKKVISEIEMYPTTMSRENAKLICKNECLPFLHDISLGMLVNEDTREMFVNLMVLSPSPSGDIGEQKLITRCIVELIVLCSGIQESARVENDNIAKLNDQKSILMEHLIEVANVWNDAQFVNETDHFQQQHITYFILDAMDYMQKDNDDAYQDAAIQSLVIGVTNRLNVSETSIRHDGMMVAEKLAPILGQELKFDELDGTRDEELHGSRSDETIMESYRCLKSDVESNQIKPKRKRKKKIVAIDPDEEYLSDYSSLNNDESESDCASNDPGISDVDSEWSEEENNIIPIDDEEDLRPIQKPKYLQECLNLLRGSDDDHDSKHMLEIALSEVSTLVRDCPPDLGDMASIITKELLCIENRYNSPSFSQNRWDGLCSLAACAPIYSIPCLQAEVYAEVSLEVRLDSLAIMQHASYELCGQTELDKRRKERGDMVKSSSSNQNLAVKVTENLKTRRWGHKQHSKASVTNKFGELSPLFFYPLIQGFLRSKSDKILWGGENGGRLLSSLLITLSTCVDCAGIHPGKAILSSDLFDLAWSFRQAQNPEVRHAVLVSVAICLPQLNPIALTKILSTEQLPEDLKRIKEYDSNSECRQLASLILGSFSGYRFSNLM